MKRQILWKNITTAVVVMLIGMTLCACHKDDDILSGSKAETIDPSAPLHLYLGVNAGNSGLSWEEQSGTRAFSCTRANGGTRAGVIRPETMSSVVTFNLYVDGDEERPDKNDKDQSYIQSFMPNDPASPIGSVRLFVPIYFAPAADSTQNNQQVYVPKPVIEAKENENKGDTIYLSLDDYEPTDYADGKLVIYYTMDGTDPRESETKITVTDNGPRPIILSADEVLKAATKYERKKTLDGTATTEEQEIEIFWSEVVTFPKDSVDNPDVDPGNPDDHPVNEDGSIIVDPFFNQTESGGNQQGNTTVEELEGYKGSFVVIDYNEATHNQGTGESDNDAQLTRNHETQYGFMGIASTAGSNGDSPTLNSLSDYMNNYGTSYLQWNDGAKVMDTKCTMLIAKPVKTHDPKDKNYDPTRATKDGDLILKDGNAYIPLVLRPAMACIQLCFHLSYKRAMTSGGAQSDDVGFRQYVITGVRLNKTPALTESGKSNLDNTGDPVSRASANDQVMSSNEVIPLIATDSENKPLSHTLISDQQEDGNPVFTPIARFYVLPQSSNTEIKLPVTITYDVYDRGNNLLRKGETATSNLIFSRGYQPGYYYNIKIKIVPDFLYVMSDIDPDKPDGVVVVKNN